MLVAVGDGGGVCARTPAMSQSRHVTTDEDEYSHRIRTRPPPWRIAAAMCAVSSALYAGGLGATALVLVAAAVRLGPLNYALCMLPEIASYADFANRKFRVRQSLWLVSICCSIYTIIPEEMQQASKEGWKMNLVTMETSMASGIAATYGYSVAGGVPGGLLAEFVMAHVGRATVNELTPLLGNRVANAGVAFALFFTMGSFMEWLAQTGYAFAHPRDLVRDELDSPRLGTPQNRPKRE